MNGECKTWSMYKFYSWEEFLEMPDDIKIQYINNLLGRYEVGATTISECLFKKNPAQLQVYLRKNGLDGRIKFARRGDPKKKRANRERFIEAIEKQNRVEMASSTPEEVADISEEPIESALDFSTNPDGKFIDPVPVTFGAPVEEPCADIQEKKVKPGVSSMLINMDGFDLELIDYLSMQKFKDKKVKITMTINVVED